MILCFGHFNIQKGGKIYFQIRSRGEDKIPKRTDINNLRILCCITLLVKTCFSRYTGVIFDKKKVLVKNSTIRDIIRKVEELTRRIEQSEKELKFLRGENKALKDENAILRAAYAELRVDNEKLRAEWVKHFKRMPDPGVSKLVLRIQERQRFYPSGLRIVSGLCF